MTSLGVILIVIVLVGLCATVLLNVRIDAHDSLGRIESRIDSLLPQTQCEQCGYRGCRPYARAIVRDRAAIDLCPPGGRSTATAISEMLGRGQVHLHDFDAVPEGSDIKVVIDEARCIGCTKCIPVCPVDAIIGAQKQMHTVIEYACTGCALCIDPCPVDCIEFTQQSSTAENWRWHHPLELEQRVESGA